MQYWEHFSYRSTSIPEHFGRYWLKLKEGQALGEAYIVFLSVYKTSENESVVEGFDNGVMQEELVIDEKDVPEDVKKVAREYLSSEFFEIDLIRYCQEL